MSTFFRLVANRVERETGMELVRNRKSDATAPRDDNGKCFEYSVCAPMEGASMRHVNFHTLRSVLQHLEQEEIKRND